MEKNYIVLDPDGADCGSLRIAICADYPALDKIMPFSRSVESAENYGLPDPHSFGFEHFEKQLPTRDIYPVAVLLDLEIHYKKQRRGYGISALRGFRAVAAEQNARLGLLRIGTGAGEEYSLGMPWRRDFYAKDGWVTLNSPPLPGLVLVWMYHPLPEVTDRERLERKRLIEAEPERDKFGPLEE